jgi:hypothetical protein
MVEAAAEIAAGEGHEAESSLELRRSASISSPLGEHERRLKRALCFVELTGAKRQLADTLL